MQEKIKIISKMLKAIFKSGLIVSAFLIFNFAFCIISHSQEVGEYVNKAWAASGQGNFIELQRVTDECIEKFSKTADELALGLIDFPAQEVNSTYQVMIDVATCYFIKGEGYVKQGAIALKAGDQKEADKNFMQAKEVFSQLVKRYPFAQAWDPRGWFWSLREAAEKTVEKIDKNEVVKMGVEKPYPIQKQTTVKLHDKGSELPIDYRKYGKFTKVGTKDYKYLIDDPIGLSEAVGEAIYPNTNSIKFDPKFVEIKKKLYKIDHWKILNSRDLETAFYKWNMAPEPQGVRQFYVGDILERSGELEQAVKAYYSVLVHFPQTYGWTYWQTPWYIGKVALYRIKHILKNNPKLNLELKGASIEIKNGFDNDIRNDEYLVNPGKLVKKSIFNKLYDFAAKKRDLGKIKKTVGKGNIKLVQYEKNDWQLRVDGKPFMMKGITYGPTATGESPDDGTLQNWTTQDTNNNGIIDAPYESWVDKNKNNKQERNEKTVGDFKLLKEMGANTIRLYIQPFELNKKLLGQMHEKYGIYVILGDFLGKYAIGSGATWEEGTDYDNPIHQENMLNSIKNMVTEFSEEPYVLMWVLGNENVYGLGCNADTKPASFFKFANRAAKLIKKLDPKQRPVLLASGDIIYLNIFAKECPDVDVFGANAYRGHHGFLDFWDEVKKISGKPAIITEYGSSSYSNGFNYEESQDYQAKYHRNAWIDMVDNSAGYGAGNSLGGVAFEWLDEWWKAYEPSFHDRKALFAGPFLDGYMHEEWLGVCSQGEGTDSPFLRQLNKAYFVYKDLWNKK